MTTLPTAIIPPYRVVEVYSPARERQLVRRYKLLTLAIGLMVLASIVLTACHSTIKSEPSPAAMAHGEATARLGVRIDSTTTEIVKAETHADAIGKEHLSTAKEILAVAKSTDLHEIIVTMAQREREFAENMAVVTGRADAAEKLATWEREKREGVENHWYVQWGRRIEAWFWVISIGSITLCVLWLVGGFAAPFLPLMVGKIAYNVSKTAGGLLFIGVTWVETGIERLNIAAANKLHSHKIETLISAGAPADAARAVILNKPMTAETMGAIA